jgi:hypothetical protein
VRNELDQHDAVGRRGDEAPDGRFTLEDLDRGDRPWVDPTQDTLRCTGVDRAIVAASERSSVVLRICCRTLNSVYRLSGEHMTAKYRGKRIRAVGK